MCFLLNLVLRVVGKCHKWSFMSSSQDRVVFSQGISQGINSNLSGNG